MASATRAKLFPSIKRLSEHVVTHAKGSRVFTQDGPKRGLLDFTAGIGVVSTGHCHPTVARAVAQQASTLVHGQMSCYHHAGTLALIERLTPLMPHPALDSFFFANSGAEAVEGAVRLARQATGRDTVICFSGGYHGRTALTLGMTTSGAGYRGARTGPLPGGVAFAPYPYAHLGPHRSSDACLAELDALAATQCNPADIAAVVLEPVLGEGGYVQAPAAFMRGLRAFCDAHGALLVADEVQSGFGRTGTMFAVEQAHGCDPDVLVLAKGIASGYPLSCVVTRGELSAKQSLGAMGGTYGGNAVSTAAALATLDVFEAEGVLANVEARGAQLRAGLERCGARVNARVGGPPIVADVRGPGLMVAAEFNVALKGLAGDVSAGMGARGTLAMTAGVRETMRFMPPLVVTEEEVDEAVAHFGEALDEAVEARRQQQQGDT